MTLTTLLRWTLGLAAAAALSSVSISAAPVGAPDSPDTALPAKRVVKEVKIEFSGPSVVDEGRIRTHIATHEGGPYSQETIEKDVKNLYATGSIENVDVDTQEVAGGLRVIFKITSRGAVGEIKFEGNYIVGNNTLKEKTEIKVGDSVDDAKLFNAQSKIREAYTDKGYGDIKVSYKTEPMTRAGYVRVIFIVDEGEKDIIKDIRFEGLTAVPAKKLKDKLKLKVYHSYDPFQWWGKSGTVDNDSVTEDIHTVETAMQDQGYVYAKVVQLRREPVKKDRVNLVFVVDQGKRYNVSEVAVDGNKIFTVEQLRPGLSLYAGDRYSVSKIRADEKMIGDYYGSRGYADARVDTSIIPTGPDSVKVLYRITEGDLSHIGKVNIQGNTKTQDKVIRRELSFSPGDEFNTVRIANSKKRLENMGYFSTVDFRNESTNTPGYKDINVTVTEQSTGSVQIGAGFSSIDSVVGFVSLTQTNFDITNWPNFTGAGERFNISVQAGDERRDYTINWTNPFLFGQRLSFSVNLFYDLLDFLSPNNTYDQLQYGVTFSLRKPLGEHDYAELSYTIESVEIENLASFASPQIRAEAGEFTESKIDLSWVQDTRDTQYLTRNGHKIQAGVTVIGGPLGGGVDAYQLHAEASQYISLPWDMILLLDAAVQTVAPFDGADSVPIFERLFLGGANNLRGFKYRDVGPIDATGEPLGGLTSLYGTAELTFPIFEKVRGALFYDVGQIGTSQYQFNGQWDADVGIGVRLYLLPTGPIRLDFGVPVVSQSYNDSQGRFNFNIGYRF